MPPEQILAAILVAGIILYTLLGGADFGVGVWEFSTFFQSSEKEKNHLYRAIGPVWEANHVWLIFILVILFSAFPRAFASVCRTLWLPLLLALVGIIFRGVGFAFRSYAAGMVKQQAIWGGHIFFWIHRNAIFLRNFFWSRGFWKIELALSLFHLFGFFLCRSLCLPVGGLFGKGGRAERCNRSGDLGPPSFPHHGSLDGDFGRHRAFRYCNRCPFSVGGFQTSFLAVCYLVCFKRRHFIVGIVAKPICDSHHLFANRRCQRHLGVGNSPVSLFNSIRHDN